MVHSPFTMGFRYVFFHACAVVAGASLLANLLPRESLLEKRPKLRKFYGFLVDYVAFFALNLRADLPSLDQEFLGFRRHIRHAYRNWRQDRLDKAQITITAASIEGIKVTRQE